MTPKGTTKSVMSIVISIVPNRAGQIPPSVFASRGSSVTKRQRRPRNRPTRRGPRQAVHLVDAEDARNGLRRGEGLPGAVLEEHQVPTVLPLDGPHLVGDALRLAGELPLLDVEGRQLLRQRGIVGLEGQDRVTPTRLHLLEPKADLGHGALLDPQAGDSALLRLLHPLEQRGKGSRALRHDLAGGCGSLALRLDHLAHAPVGGPVLDPLEREEVLGLGRLRRRPSRRSTGSRRPCRTGRGSRPGAGSPPAACCRHADLAGPPAGSPPRRRRTRPSARSGRDAEARTWRAPSRRRSRRCRAPSGGAAP